MGAIACATYRAWWAFTIQRVNFKIAPVSSKWTPAQAGAYLHVIGLEFVRHRTGVEMAPKNKASFSEIRAQNGGLPDWRLFGRNFPRIFRSSRADRWELNVPYF